jgi:predicted regulator of Ras-like GTPase activity (Roadblock/LC7/MglB family)
MLTTLEQQIEKIGTMLSENPEDIGVLIAYAEFHYRRGRYLESLQAYQKVVAIRQDISDVHLGLAKIYMRQNMIADAYSELLQVFEIMPHNIEAHIIFRRLKDIEEPFSEIEEAFLRFSDCEPDLLDLGLYKQQKELEVEKMEQEIGELEKIMEEHDEEPIFEYNYEMAVMRKKSIEGLFSYIENLQSHLTVKASLLAEKAVLEAEIAAREAEKEALEAEKAARELTEIQEVPGEMDELDIGPDLMTPGEEGDILLDIEGTDEKKLDIDTPEDSIDMPGLPDDIIDLQAVEEDRASITSEDIPGLEEESSAVEEPVDEKAAVSAERLTFYGEIKESVTIVIAGLIKTKGVTVVMTVARDGHVIDSIINEAIGYDEIGDIVRAGVDSIARWRSNEQGKAFLYWVLEFEQGLLVIRAVNNEHYLLAVAKAGANFGAMRFGMEKGKEALDEILSMAPPM